MRLPSRFHPEVESEFVDALIFYSDRAPQIGEAFLRLVNRALERCSENPGWRQLGLGSLTSIVGR